MNSSIFFAYLIVGNDTKAQNVIYRSPNVMFAANVGKFSQRLSLVEVCLVTSKIQLFSIFSWCSYV